ncbi:MAG: dTDP-glucose 4,6-dehydratase [Verrucomicrobiales bacterium]|nr:dTDP-glucose 4,6-dehydratase [Verrucomicrobiales bacterium]|tara:strand:+ start:2324 stop:3352 length:1029 start_codon:yes stop_codon:yes gene_type:complete
MRLLVTGGAGFIGSNLIRAIIDRPELECLINLDCLSYAGNLASLRDVEGNAKHRFQKVDLRDKDALRSVVKNHAITHVIHLAAESHVDRSVAGPDDFIHTNVVGTFNLLEACRDEWTQNGALRDDCRFHHVSTDEVYGSLGASGQFIEESPFAPNSPYSASKASSDLLVRSYRQTYGMNTVVTNSSNNYGPFQHPEKLIPVVIQALANRAPIPVYGDGQNVRDWLHVTDHVDALWLVLNHGSAGETYNIGTRNERTNLSVVELLCDLFGELQPDARGDSRALISFVDDRPGHDRRYAIDASKIENELGWKPNADFRSTLRDTVQWYLTNQDWIFEVVKRSSR